MRGSARYLVCSHAPMPLPERSQGSSRSSGFLPGIMLCFVFGLTGVLLQAWTEPPVIYKGYSPPPTDYIRVWSLACAIGGVLSVVAAFVESLVRGNSLFRDLRPILGLFAAFGWLTLMVLTLTEAHPAFRLFFFGGKVWAISGTRNEPSSRNSLNINRYFSPP